MSFGLYPFVVCLGLLLSWTLAYEDPTKDFLKLLDLPHRTDEPPADSNDCWQPTGPMPNIMPASPPPLGSEEKQRKRPGYELDDQRDPKSRLTSEPLPRSSGQPNHIIEDDPTTATHFPWTLTSDAYLRSSTMKESRFDHHPSINSETRSYIQSGPEMMKMPAYQDNIFPQKETVWYSDSTTPRTSERESIPIDYIDYLDLQTRTSQLPKSLLPMSRIEQKSKFDRLVFDEETFKDPSLPSEHQQRIIRINAAFKNLEVMKILMQRDEHALWRETLNSYHYVSYDGSVDKRSDKRSGQPTLNEAKRAFWNDSCKELWKSRYDWIGCWERRSSMNLARIDLIPLDDEPFKDLKRLLILFLFYVDMIETIIQVKFKSTISYKTDYHDHPSNFFQDSVKTFKKFRELQYREHQQKSKTKIINDHITDHHPVKKSSKIPRKRIHQIIWLYVDYWLTYSQKFNAVEIFAGNKDLINKFKGFFNDLFAYSIRHFNQKLSPSSPKIN
ncbi:hypothetical protein MJO28_011202 [Puccinia striiformis f. sp. tritici]|uniref:Uncharacterized protein n=1 Tax=Puccinia striiformis f. sp. tritici TaxID=168172 RepID=A0ACC0E325_9BASI|nr:hypothetical protein MJO28_011202 [Puccinia striiformis f. sp. tritici]